MESLNLEATTPEKPKKEKPMSKKIDISTLSFDELQDFMTEAKARIEEQSKDETIKIIAEMLKGCTPEQVTAIKGVLTGENKIVPKTVKPTGGKPPKPPKEGAKSVFELVEGKVFFGGQEITATKKDINGVLRISKSGKGLPPVVENQEESIKKILLTLPQI